MEYPEEIYATRDGGMHTDHFKNTGAGWGRRHAYNIGCAKGYQSGYEAGKAEQADPLAGYSNLTEAIKSEKPIDWEKLDGLNVHCVNPELGALIGKLDRDICSPIDDAHGWWDSGMGGIYIEAFDSAWCGRDGWTLWVEGEIPLVRKTADQLEVGTYFLGACVDKKEWFMYVGGEPLGDIRTVYYAPEMFKSDAPASNWVVLEELGTFKKPEDK